MYLGDFTVIEHLPDGRLLVEPNGRRGVLVVIGTSDWPTEAARMGYQGSRSRSAPRISVPRASARRRTELPPRVAAAEAALEREYAERVRARRPFDAAAEARAAELFLSLLDDEQRSMWARHRCCWVPTDRGPLRLGRLHDLRFRPVDLPGEEWSLCVVPTGPPLPPGDVWANLILTLAVDPEQFFLVASIRKTGLPLSEPHPSA